MHRRLFMNMYVPLNIKLTVFKAYVLPIGTMGGEITGPDDAEWLKPLQLVLHEAVQMMVLGTGGLNASMHMRVMLRELGLTSMRAQAVGAYVRARIKYPALNSLASVILMPADPKLLPANAAPFPALFAQPRTELREALAPSGRLQEMRDDCIGPVDGESAPGACHDAQGVGQPAAPSPTTITQCSALRADTLGRRVA